MAGDHEYLLLFDVSKLASMGEQSFFSLISINRTQVGYGASGKAIGLLLELTVGFGGAGRGVSRL